VVEGRVLKASLDSGKIAAAVLDVWENEPLVDPDLLKRIRIATPHIAGYSTDGKSNGTMQAVRAAGEYFNFPVKEWLPSGIPAARQPVLTMDCMDRSPEQLVLQAILHTYNVMEDDTAFRADPGNFELLRGRYPVRREFPAYKIVLRNPSSWAEVLFRSLGFAVITENETAGLS
jgi:erythronate-4-phosphate dehydrogenase